MVANECLHFDEDCTDVRASLPVRVRVRADESLQLLRQSQSRFMRVGERCSETQCKLAGFS